MGNNLFKEPLQEITENKKHINEYMLYHITNLTTMHEGSTDTNTIEKLKEILKNNPYTSHEDIIKDMDYFADLYIQNCCFLHAKNIYAHALTLREWILPTYHNDITKNLEKLMECHSNLNDLQAARVVFETIQHRRNFSRYIYLKNKK